jgi:hypothetical protein
MATPENEQRAYFHFGEGNKFALESAKSLFLFNSTLVIALIGFMGATKLLKIWIVAATLIFLLVATIGVTILGLGYVINLREANSYLSDDKDHKDNLWKSANELIKKIGWLVQISFALMVLGIACLGGAAFVEDRLGQSGLRI